MYFFPLSLLCGEGCFSERENRQSLSLSRLPVSAQRRRGRRVGMGGCRERAEDLSVICLRFKSKVLTDEKKKVSLWCFSCSPGVCLTTQNFLSFLFLLLASDVIRFMSFEALGSLLVICVSQTLACLLSLIFASIW